MNRWPWLIRSAAILSASVAHAQIALPPDTDLFSGELPPSYRSGHPSWAEPEFPRFQPMLTFRDNRQLHGELKEITADEIIWQRLDASKPLRLPRSAVRRIVLAPPPNERNPFPPAFREQAASTNDEASKPAAPPATATLQLAGGEWIFGTVQSVGEQSFIVKLDERTPMSIPRSGIQWLYFDTKPAPGCGFFGSASDLKNWLPNWATFNVSAGTLVVGGTEWMGRNISPPKRCEVEFEVPADSEDGTCVWLQPIGPRANWQCPGTLWLRLGRTYIQREFRTDRVDREIIPLPKEVTASGGPSNYHLFVDGGAQHVVLRRNGRPLADWHFSGLIKAANSPDVPRELWINSISFSRGRDSDDSPLKFNRLRVRPWNGTLPGDGDAPRNEDSLSTEDGTVMRGKLESVTEREIRFSGGTQPIRPGTFVEFSNAPAAMADANTWIELGRHGGFAAKNLEVHDGKARCQTSFAATLDLPATALQAITFDGPPETATPAGDLLVFRNGDELAGQAIAATSAGPVRWRLTEGQEVEFAVAQIAGVRTAGDFAKTASDKSGTTVEMRNGDRLRGQLVALDDRQMHFEDTHLGPIALDRDRLWRLYPGPNPDVADGSSDPAVWMSRRFAGNHAIGHLGGDNPWIYLDGTYFLRPAADSTIDYAKIYSPERPGLLREIDPALERFEARLELDSLTEDAPQFLIGLLTEDGATALQIAVYYNRLYVSVAPDGNHPSYREIHFEDPSDLIARRRAMRLFFDSGKGTCDMVLNGLHLAQVGQDPKERFTGSRFLLWVRPYSISTFPSILTNLWLGPWCGEPVRSDDLRAGSTTLENGDVTPGAPQVFHEGKFSLETSLGPLEVPLEKTVAVDFGGEMRPERTAGRIRLTDGTTFNVDSFRWDGHELAAHSRTLGDLRFAGDSVSELIYSPAQLHAPMTPEPKKLTPSGATNTGGKTEPGK